MKESKSNDIKTTTKRKPAMTPEAREEQLIAMAYDEVELRIKNHTATSQELTHFLKLGTSMARLEKKKLEIDTELSQAKIKAYGSAEELKKMYADAMTAFSSYRSSLSDE